MSQGLLVCIVAPSGGGKTTIVTELIKQLPKATRFITSTTRAPRPGEKNGVDYHFLTRSEFVYKITEGQLLEYVEYAGNFYGTDRSELEKLLAANDYILVAIDVRGSRSFQTFKYKQKRIFLKPESLEVLRTRLARRPGITEAEVERRLAPAVQEIAAAPEFDAVVVNHEGHLAETVAEVKKLLTEMAK